MKKPEFRVLNTKSGGFCDFSKFTEALAFYKDGISRNEPYVFIILHPESLKFLFD